MKPTRAVIALLSVLLLLQLLYLQFHDTFAAHTHGEETQIRHGSAEYFLKTIQEGQQVASNIVVARVSQVQQAPDMVVEVGPVGKKDVIREPNQRITLEVVQSLQGAPIRIIKLFHYGTEEQFIEGDPPYEVGQTYVLFVRPKRDEPGTHLVVAPQGRYLVTKDTLQPMVDDHEGLAPLLRGKQLAEFKQLLVQTGPK